MDDIRSNHPALFKRAVPVLVAGGLAVGMGTTLVAPAHADPSGAPQYREIVSVGSDTTQDVNNGLGAVLKIASDGPLVYGSFDAVNPSNGAAHDLIQTRDGGPQFERPNGSGEGFTALKAAKTSTAWQGVTLSPSDITVSRSSSGPSSIATSGTYTYIPLAEDAVSYARSPRSVVPANLPLGTSVGQDSDGDGTHDLTLKNIYGTAGSGEITLENSSDQQFTVGQQGSGAQIVPFIPQSGSGTRKFWAQTILGNQNDSFPARVFDHYAKGSSSVQVEEHDGSVIADVTGAIAPFSIAQYIAQGKSTSLASDYGITVNNRIHSAVLGQVDGVSPENSDGTLNTAFPIARPVFTVAKYADLSDGSDLAKLFKGSTALAYNATNSHHANQLVLTDFGFGDIRDGASIGGKTYTAGDVDSFRTN